MTPYFWIQLVGNLSSLVLIYFSLRAFTRSAPFYIKLFSILCIIEQLAEVVVLASPITWRPRHLASDVVVLGELFTYTFIFLNIIRSRIYRILLKIYFVLNLSYYVYYYIKYGVKHGLNDYPQVLFFLILLIGTLIYFREVVNDREETNLFHEFNFWWFAGMSFYASTNVITILMIYYLDTTVVRSNYFFDIFTTACYTIVNVIHSKAYLCLKKPQTVA